MLIPHLIYVQVSVSIYIHMKTMVHLGKTNVELQNFSLTKVYFYAHMKAIG
jgi:hypothetical protein